MRAIRKPVHITWYGLCLPAFSSHLLWFTSPPVAHMLPSHSLFDPDPASTESPREEARRAPGSMRAGSCIKTQLGVRFRVVALLLLCPRSGLKMTHLVHWDRLYWYWYERRTLPPFSYHEQTRVECYMNIGYVSFYSWGVSGFIAFGL